MLTTLEVSLFHLALKKWSIVGRQGRRRFYLVGRAVQTSFSPRYVSHSSVQLWNAPIDLEGRTNDFGACVVVSSPSGCSAADSQLVCPQCILRTAVIFRDPRDVVISEFKMRRDFYHQDMVLGISLDDFILRRFEVNVGSSLHLAPDPLFDVA